MQLRAPAVLPMPRGTLDTIDIERLGRRLTLRRSGDGFEVSTPARDIADERAASAAFTALEGLQLSGPSRRIPDATLVRVTGKHRGRVVLELLIGDGDHLVRIDGRDYQTKGAKPGLYDRAPDDWRERRLAVFSSTDVQQIEIETSDGSHIALTRWHDTDADADRWRPTRSSVAIDKLDEMVPREIVIAFASLRASGFADDVSPAAAGLDPPALTVRAQLAGGRTATLFVGAAAGEDEVYVRTPDRPRILRAKRLDVDRINRRPLQFRDKILCDIPDVDVVSFGVTSGAQSYAVVRQGEGWKATRPTGLRLDPAKVAPLATVFRRWSAPRIAEDPPRSAFRVPRAVIVGQSRNASCTIRVGGESTDAPGYFVQTPTSPDVFIVPKWMIDRIVVPLDELRKA